MKSENIELKAEMEDYQTRAGLLTNNNLLRDYKEGSLIRTRKARGLFANYLL